MPHKPSKKDFFGVKIPDIRLGFELWEIFTAFTLALTLASVLIWFSSLQPKRLEEEFFWQEQSKIKLYNLALEASSLDKKPLDSLRQEIVTEDVCEVETPKEPNKENYRVFKAKLESLDEKFLEIEKEIPIKTTFLKSQPSFREIYKHFFDLKNLAQDNLEKKLFFADQILEIRRTKSWWCSPENITEINPEIWDNFTAELDKNGGELALDLKVEAQEIRDFYKAFQNSEQVELSSEDKQKLIDLYKDFLELADADAFVGSLDLSNQTTLAKLGDYERWQKSYVLDKKRLAEKVVFITTV